MKNKEEANIWYNFFVKYFLLGLVLIILYIIYDVEIKLHLTNFPFWQRFLDIIFSVICILGPSLVVASLFTFSIESRNFIDYIKDKIEKVIIKKEFLNKLNDLDKRDALERILTPSNEKFQIYDNFKKYFEETISKAMTLFDCTFKSNFTIDVYATVNNNKVCFDETICQKLYKGINGFDQIKFGFCNYETEPEFVSVHYIHQNGVCKQLLKEDFKITDRNDSGSKWIMYSYEIPKSIEDDFISLIIKYKEYGYDHWQLFSYKTMIPSEGIRVIINCSDNLIIKEHLIFDNEKNYICWISNDKKRLEISTSQWISSGNGVNVLVAKE